LGGYVKIAGMVDESMDKEQMKMPAQPWEFRSKPAWQRLIIMIGGVTVNVLLAFVIYAMILFTWGETKLPMKNLTNGIWAIDSINHEIGLQTGDKIVAVNGEPVKYFEDLNAQFLLGETITIDRYGELKNVTIPENFIEQIVEKMTSALVLPRIPVIVGEVSDSSYAKQAGLKVKDVIKGIDGKEVRYFDQIKPLLANRGGYTIKLTVDRDGKDLVLTTVLVKMLQLVSHTLGMDDENNVCQFEKKNLVSLDLRWCYQL
jgi:regulator of sigma E protease